MVKSLESWSIADLKGLIRRKTREQKAAPLIRKRDRLEVVLGRLEKRIAALSNGVRPKAASKPKAARKPKVRKLSKSGRAKIVAAQKKRWAAARKAAFARFRRRYRPTVKTSPASSAPAPAQA